MSMVKLTGMSGRPIYVRAEAVELVESSGVSDAGGSVLRISCGEMFSVREAPFDVAHKIDSEKQGQSGERT